MTSPKLAAGLSALTDRYDVLLCDVWGVIHNGREAFPAACLALARFREQGGEVVLISNAPRPNAGVIEQLDRLGVPRETYSLVVTSGDATRKLLAERARLTSLLLSRADHLGFTPETFYRDRIEPHI